MPKDEILENTRVEHVTSPMQAECVQLVLRERSTDELNPRMENLPSWQSMLQNPLLSLFQALALAAGRTGLALFNGGCRKFSISPGGTIDDYDYSNSGAHHWHLLS